MPWYLPLILLLSLQLAASDLTALFTMAKENHPQYEQFTQEQSALEAQAALTQQKANPELEIELENGGIGGFGLTIAQELTRREPRVKAEAAVLSEQRAIALSRVQFERDLFVETAALMADFDLQKKSRDLLALEQQLLDSLLLIVQRRVSRSLAAPHEAALVKAEQALLTVQRQSSEARLRGTVRAVERLTNRGELSLSTTVQPRFDALDVAAITASSSTDLAAQVAAIGTAEAALALEQVAYKPAPTLALGYERNNEEGSNALKLGFAMALPLRNKNQRGIAVAAAQKRVATATLTAAERDHQLRVATLIEQYRQAQEQYRAFSDEQIAALNEAEASLQRAYNRGRIDLSELLQLTRSRIAIEQERLHRGNAVTRAALAIYTATDLPLPIGESK